MVENEKMKKKIKITVKTKKKTNNNNSLTTAAVEENARDEVTTDMLLVKNMRQMFQEVDKEQEGSFIHGSMQRLSNKWKKLVL